MANTAKVRPPSVAGLFYQDGPEALKASIEGCYIHPLGPGTLPLAVDRPLKGPTGLILPHAGYTYSGPIAARGVHVLASMGRPEGMIVLGPNHYGLGAGIASSPHDLWSTPLGLIAVDKGLEGAIRGHFPELSPDQQAHVREHSIEVVLPFLQHLYRSALPFVPISMNDQSLETSVRLGEALARAVGDKGCVIIASSDLSHYHPQGIANDRDRKAIDAILTLRPTALDEAIERYNINMCGPGPVMALLACMRALGIRGAQLLGYATSGDTSGDYGAVVGYTAILIS